MIGKARLLEETGFAVFYAVRSGAVPTVLSVERRSFPVPVYAGPFYCGAGM